MSSQVLPHAPGKLSELAAADDARPEGATTPIARTPYVVLAVWVALGVAVFWAFDAMPFQDLPAHAGLIALRERLGHSMVEQQYFVQDAHVGPYTLFRVLGSLFSRVVGPVGAARALGTLPILAMPAALLYARRRLHGDLSATPGFVGVALSFGFMTVMGFASYQLGLAILVGVLPSWLAAVRDRASSRERVMLAAGALLLFIAHGHVFALFLVVAGVTWALQLAESWRSRRSAAPASPAVLVVRTGARVLPLIPAFVLAVTVAIIERRSPAPPGAAVYSGNMTTLFQGAYDKFSLLITPTLMTKTGIDFLVGVILWVWVLAASVRMTQRVFAQHQHGEVHQERLLMGATLALWLLFLVLPHNYGWFGFVDGRIVPLLLLLPYLAAPPDLFRATRTPQVWAAAGLAALVLGSALRASTHFQREALGYREVLGQIPAGASILNLPLDPNSDVFTGHPFVHYDKLVLADRPSVPSDLWFHQGTAVYATPGHPALTLPNDYVESDMHDFRWEKYDLARWDYVLIRTRPNGTPPAPPSTLRLVEHRGGWWLYQR
jgi:hypothetical protein